MVKTVRFEDDAEQAALYKFMLRKHVRSHIDKKLLDLWWVINAKQIINGTEQK